MIFYSQWGELAARNDFPSLIYWGYPNSVSTLIVQKRRAIRLATETSLRIGGICMHTKSLIAVSYHALLLSLWKSIPSVCLTRPPTTADSRRSAISLIRAERKFVSPHTTANGFSVTQHHIRVCRLKLHYAPIGICR